MQPELLAASEDGSFVLVPIIIAVYLAVIAFGVFIYAKIVARSGYPWPWVFIMFVPIVNLVMLCIFALRPWPVERELELTRRALEAATGSPFPPGSQLPAYGNYQIGSGAASGYPQGYEADQGYGGYSAPQSYSAPQGYGAPSFDAPADQGYGATGQAYPTQPTGETGQRQNPYSAFSPEQNDTPEGPKY